MNEVDSLRESNWPRIPSVVPVMDRLAVRSILPVGGRERGGRAGRWGKNSVGGQVQHRRIYLEDPIEA